MVLGLIGDRNNGTPQETTCRRVKPQHRDTYGPVQRAINRRLKKALDPNGILAPGESGIR
jgi:hypothetical protein